MNNIFSKLALTTAGLAVGLAIADVPSVQAATINYTFDITLDSGPLINNNYSGTFSYDDLTLDVTDFAFTFQGQDYDENDDLGATVGVDDNSFLGLIYSVDTVPSFSFVPGFSDISEALFAYDLQPSSVGEGGAGSIVYTRVEPKPVPEPATILGSLTALGFGAKLKRKGSRQLKKDKDKDQAS